MAEDRRDKSQPLERFFALALVLVPTIGFVAAVAFSALVRFSWVDLALGAGFYLVTALGITGGFHRLFAHRSFQAPAAVRAAFAVAGCMAAQGPTIFWVASHRKHHRYSDQAGDPHSPHVHADGSPAGFWHGHIGWVFQHDHEGWKRYVPDLLRDPLVLRIDRVYGLWLLMGLALPAAIGFAAQPSWQGAVGGFLWGGLARMFLWHHATYSINSVCHLIGARPYATNDTSRNNGVCALLTLGEGWHNNHHAFPSSARHGLEWWQLDMTYGTVRLLERLRLASNVLLPDARVIASKTIPQADPEPADAEPETATTEA